ncbi:sigma-70 family RNA polymerase sigma factor (plasmid) [Nocardiopsis flavescens]|nr:sigma-70 family RNA polymerase sigma factor [Nocardiopsis flavescens]
MPHDEHNTEATGELLGGQADELHRRAAYVRFVDAHYHLVVRFLVHCGARIDDAVDATQEAFLEAWREAIHRTDRVIANPAGWIRQVALNKYRRPPGPRKRPPTVLGLPVPDRSQPGPGHAELTDQALDVLRALHRLEPTDRAVIAFSMDGFSSVEAAEYLGITPQKARDILKRARRRLAAELAHHPRQEGGHR